MNDQLKDQSEVIEKLALGESSFIEYKEKFNKDKVGEEIVGFCNSISGHIFIGIDDAGNIVGIENPDKIINTISSIISDAMKPHVGGILLKNVKIKKEMKTCNVIHCSIPYQGIPITYKNKYYQRIGTVNKEIAENVIWETHKIWTITSNFRLPKSLIVEEIILYLTAVSYGGEYEFELILDNEEPIMMLGKSNYDIMAKPLIISYVNKSDDLISDTLTRLEINEYQKLQIIPKHASSKYDHDISVGKMNLTQLMMKLVDVNPLIVMLILIQNSEFAEETNMLQYELSSLWKKYANKRNIQNEYKFDPNILIQFWDTKDRIVEIHKSMRTLQRSFESIPYLSNTTDYLSVLKSALNAFEINKKRSLLERKAFSPGIIHLFFENLSRIMPDLLNEVVFRTSSGSNWIMIHPKMFYNYRWLIPEIRKDLSSLIDETVTFSKSDIYGELAHISKFFGSIYYGIESVLDDIFHLLVGSKTDNLTRIIND